MLDRPSSSRADRWRRYRARQKTGAVAVRGDVPLVLVEFLIELQWLDERDGRDPAKVFAALVAMGEEAARSRSPPRCSARRP